MVVLFFAVIGSDNDWPEAIFFPSGDITGKVFTPPEISVVTCFEPRSMA